MKRLMAIISALVLLLGCGGTGSDFESALKAKIAEQTGDPGARVRIFKMEQTGQGTLGEELQRRKDVFQLQMKQNGRLYEVYMSKGKPRNAMLKLEAIDKAQRVLRQLDSLEEEYVDVLDSVIFYDYRFSGEAVTKDSRFDLSEAYASITPDGKVLSVSTDVKDIHKSTGRAIPGYVDLFE